MTNLKLKDILMLIILFIIGYAILFFFGGAVLSALGLKYNSVISLAKFIAIYYKIAKEVKNISTLEYYCIFFFADISVSMVLIGITEYFIKGISCSMTTAFLFSIICFFVNMFFDLKFDNSLDNEEAA